MCRKSPLDMSLLALNLPSLEHSAPRNKPWKASETNSAKTKKDGVVTSRRRALDAALVLDYLITHDAHFLCDRDTTPACAHVVQSVCSQVQYGVHTSTATIMFGLAQHSAWENKQQIRNEGGKDSASPTQRTIYEHVSHKGGCGW
jgi:hypothetical protein